MGLTGLGGGVEARGGGFDGRGGGACLDIGFVTENEEEIYEFNSRKQNLCTSTH